MAKPDIKNGIPANEVVDAAMEENAPASWLRVIIIGLFSQPLRMGKRIAGVFFGFRYQDKETGGIFNNTTPITQEEMDRYDKKLKDRRGDRS